MFYLSALSLVVGLISGVISIWMFIETRQHPMFRRRGAIFVVISLGMLLLATILVITPPQTNANGQGGYATSTPTDTPIPTDTPTPTDTPVPTNTPIPTDTPTPTVTTSTSYVQLKSFYSGTATGYATGSITFTLQSEDQQGNISMETTFQQLGGSQKTSSYSCQGSVTTDRNISLQCSNVTDPSYLLTIQGIVSLDGHMEGTETATNTNDPGYNHVYNWKAY